MYQEIISKKLHRRDFPISLILMKILSRLQIHDIMYLRDRNIDFFYLNIFYKKLIEEFKLMKLYKFTKKRTLTSAGHKNALSFETDVHDYRSINSCSDK